MKILLEKINEILEERKSSTLKYMHEGVSRDYIIEEVKKVNIIFPEELIDLYSWRNGTRWDNVKLGLLWLFPGGIFFSLKTAIEIYIARANKDKYWKPKMFPVFGSGGGDFYLLDLDINSPTYRKIFYYCLNETDFEVIISYFDTLETAFMTIIECYKKNAYYYHYDNDNDQMLDFDIDLQKEIAKGINPNSEFWML